MGKQKKMKNSRFKRFGNWARAASVGYWPGALSACLYVLIFPKAALWPLAFAFLLPVLLMLEKQGHDPRKAFWLFWLAGMLGNIGKQYWLVYTMNHYGHIPIPLALIVFFLMNATLGCFWGFMALGLWKLRPRLSLPDWFLLPAGWVVMEWFLTWFLSGFPWDLAGNSLIAWAPLAQFGDVFGVYGLSFVTIVGNVAIFKIVLFLKNRKSEEHKFPVAATAMWTGLFLFLLIYGLVREPMIEKKLEQGKAIKVGLLQGNVDQLDKWTQPAKVTFGIFKDLAKKSADDGAELIIFPETSLPYWQKGHRKLNNNVLSFAVENKRYVLVAYPEKLPNPDPESENPWMKHNTASLINSEGTKLGTARKHKLVPFGEFLPFPDQILWLKNALGLKKARLTKGFMPATEFTAIDYPPAGRFGVAICYEVIFPALVRKIANLGTSFMITITNDSWFGNTSAPYQHVDQVAMRAIENRRSFARAANTGISCVVDATGRVRSATEPYTKTYVVDTIRTIDYTSVYGRIGDLFVYLLIAFFVGATAYSTMNRENQTKE